MTFYASDADIRTKVIVIKANARKYSISALCRCLGIARSTYYYEHQDPTDGSDLEEAIQTAYDENRRVYGQRKLKRVLFRKGWTVSRRRIGRIMARRGLVSAYTCKKYRAHPSKSNEAPIPNLLARDFNNQAPGACVVSDLTYVRVGTRWTYVCILLELGVREIIVKLREVALHCNQGKTITEACRGLGITAQTYYRWRKEYGGMNTSDDRRMKELEKENAHLKKLVAEQALDISILRDVNSKNF